MSNVKWFLHAAISSNFMHYQSQFPVSLSAPQCWKNSSRSWVRSRKRTKSDGCWATLIDSPSPAAVVSKIIYSTEYHGRCRRSTFVRPSVVRRSIGRAVGQSVGWCDYPAVHCQLSFLKENHLECWHYPSLSIYFVI